MGDFLIQLFPPLVIALAVFAFLSLAFLYFMDWLRSDDFAMTWSGTKIMFSEFFRKLRPGPGPVEQVKPKTAFSREDETR